MEQQNTVVASHKHKNMLSLADRAPSRSRKPLRLAYDSLQLASHGFYGGGVSYGGLAKGQRHHVHNILKLFTTKFFTSQL